MEEECAGTAGVAVASHEAEEVLGCRMRGLAQVAGELGLACGCLSASEAWSQPAAPSPCWAGSSGGCSSKTAPVARGSEQTSLSTLWGLLLPSKDRSGQGCDGLGQQDPALLALPCGATGLLVPFHLLFALLASDPPGHVFCSLQGRNHGWKREVRRVGWSEKMFCGATPSRGGLGTLLHVLVCCRACT